MRKDILEQAKQIKEARERETHSLNDLQEKFNDIRTAMLKVIKSPTLTNFKTFLDELKEITGWVTDNK